MSSSRHFPELSEAGYMSADAISTLAAQLMVEIGSGLLTDDDDETIYTGSAGKAYAFLKVSNNMNLSQEMRNEARELGRKSITHSLKLIERKGLGRHCSSLLCGAAVRFLGALKIFFFFH